MNRKQLYPAGALSLFSSISDPDLWLPLGIVLEGPEAFVVFITRDGRIESEACRNHTFNDIPATHVYIHQSTDGPRISWGCEGGTLESVTSLWGNVDRLELILNAGRVQERYDTVFMKVEKNLLTGYMEYCNLQGPQPEQDPLRHGIHDSGHPHQSERDTMSNKNATTAPAKRIAGARNQALRPKSTVTTGIAFAHEFEGGEEAGFVKVQVWPNAEKLKGFQGFATVTMRDVVIKDVSVREAGEKSKNPGTIYGAMPAKKSNQQGSRQYEDIVFFPAENEKNGFNRRDLLDSLVALALDRAEGREEPYAEPAK